MYITLFLIPVLLLLMTHDCLLSTFNGTTYSYLIKKNLCKFYRYVSQIDGYVDDSHKQYDWCKI